VSADREHHEHQVTPLELFFDLAFVFAIRIVLFALGLKTTLHHPGGVLETVPAVGLCGGAALYLGAEVAFLWRTTGRVFRRRTIGAIVLLALVPVAFVISALAALALVSAVCALVVAYEVLRYREHRLRVRHPELAA
jgi:low temperature requirement protein LtrA